VPPRVTLEGSRFGSCLEISRFSFRREEGKKTLLNKRLPEVTARDVSPRVVAVDPLFASDAGKDIRR
jgi:hypothetical protein